MSDDGMSASELRSRYGRGGSVRDSDLSAAQLRSRYAIPNNTFKEEKSDSSGMMMAVIALVVLAALGGAAYMFANRYATPLRSPIEIIKSRSPTTMMATHQGSRWMWTATATFTVALMSMAMVLAAGKRRRAQQLMHSTSDPIMPPRRSITRRSIAAGAIAPTISTSTQSRTTSQAQLRSPTAVDKPPMRQERLSSGDEWQRRDHSGLRVGHGLWDAFLVPVVSESIAFVAGIAVMYLSYIERFYSALMVLVAVFLFRIKSTSFATSAPLSASAKIHLLKSLNRETLYELLQDDLPRWVKFPDVEKCDWLNHIIESLWPYVKVAAARSVREALTPALEAVKPKIMMTELGFRGLDLGTAAPVVNGIKCVKVLEEQVVVDVDLLIATENTDIVFAFGNRATHMGVTIELSDFLLRGTLRIVLKPLFPRWPTFGAVVVSFTERPTINFHLRTLHVNLMEVPALSSIFHHAIRSAVENRCVWPNKIVVPLVDDLSKVELEALAANKPLGIVVITSLQLRGVAPSNPLSRWTGLHSFQLQLAVGKEKVVTTTIHSQTAHSFDGQSFYLLVLDPKTQDLSIALHYKESLRQFRNIDSKFIHLDHLEPHVPSTEVVAFGNDGSGHAEMELCWYPFSCLTQSERKRSREAPLPVEIANMGVVFIKLSKCERLTPMDYNGSSDPYVIFQLGAFKKMSSTKLSSLNPIWDPPEQFQLISSSDRHDKLQVIVMDYDYLKADDEIGRLEISLAQVQRNTHLAKTWPLENGGGFVTLELEWRHF
ncbi:TPA: hypothetical protein N0F65_003864 [Lagenidium giganteum]|uniref:Uncharacterized protein n=1 Tax=Lagenidium giganteum TaxID=4803 RepID=A0AAV2ZAR5_9STRA|nr:TPA: hypothetical protein N0F65_003864 [Lagenidium giganteum]